MTTSRQDILNDIIGLLSELADDWEYYDEITAQTRLFTDMGLASLDVVVLGTAIEEHYDRTFPFLQLYAEVGASDARDITIGEWVDFIHLHLNRAENVSASGESLDKE